MEGHQKFLKRGRSSKANLRLNWNFLGEGGCKIKTFHGGSMDIFWNYTMYFCSSTGSFNHIKTLFNTLTRLQPEF